MPHPQSESVIHPFAPVYDHHSQILILGSFPSVRSRAEGFYYGHPQNRFWQMLTAVFDEPAVPQTIEDKRRLILRHHLALWDVIASCDIIGSADASIHDAVPVDIERVTEHACIQRVLCNGNLAAKLYNKHLLPRTGIPAMPLPSTSTANAAWRPERLVEAWREPLTLP